MNYSNVYLWDGVASDFREDHLAVSEGLFVEGSRQGSRELEGAYVIPGLIDAHVHMCLNPDVRDPADQTKPGRDQVLSEMRERAAAMIRAGMT